MPKEKHPSHWTLQAQMKVSEPETRQEMEFPSREEKWKYIQENLPGLAAILLRFRELEAQVTNVRIYENDNNER